MMINELRLFWTTSPSFLQASYIPSLPLKPSLSIIARILLVKYNFEALSRIVSIYVRVDSINFCE